MPGEPAAAPSVDLRIALGVGIPFAVLAAAAGYFFGIKRRFGRGAKGSKGPGGGDDDDSGGKGGGAAADVSAASARSTRHSSRLNGSNSGPERLSSRLPLALSGERSVASASFYGATDVVTNNPAEALRREESYAPDAFMKAASGPQRQAAPGAAVALQRAAPLRQGSFMQLNVPASRVAAAGAAAAPGGGARFSPAPQPTQRIAMAPIQEEPSTASMVSGGGGYGREASSASAIADWARPSGSASNARPQPSSMIMPTGPARMAITRENTAASVGGNGQFSPAGGDTRGLLARGGASQAGVDMAPLPLSPANTVVSGGFGSPNSPAVPAQRGPGYSASTAQNLLGAINRGSSSANLTYR